MSHPSHPFCYPQLTHGTHSALYASEAVEAIKTYDSTLIDIISTAVPLPSAAPAAGAKVKRHNGEDHSESASASASASYVSASATAVEEDAVASASASAVELSENAGGRVRAGVAAGMVGLLAAAVML